MQEHRLAGANIGAAPGEPAGPEVVAGHWHLGPARPDRERQSASSAARSQLSMQMQPHANANEQVGRQAAAAGSTSEPRAQATLSANPIRLAPGAEPRHVSACGAQIGHQLAYRQTQMVPGQSGGAPAATQTQPDPNGQVNGQQPGPVGPANLAASGVHDKSMAQARYLYSTLTSNVSALLVASSQPSSSPAARPAGSQSISPTRAHGVQRKQAQFVVDRQQRAASKLAIAPVAGTSPGATSGRRAPSGAGQPGGSTCAEVDGPREGVATGRQPPIAISVPSRAGPARDRKGSSGGESSDADADDDERQGPGGGALAAAASRPDSPGRQRGAGRREESDGGVAAPSIVESACGDQRRRSSQISCSNSMDAAGQQQLQPAMDPEMHALWAQGADLDTGNGNFIMATRRRRSVHATHQVQLHQQHQQQGAAKLTGAANFGGLISMGGEQVSSKCYKIDEQQRSGYATPTSGGAPSGELASGSARRLRDELRKLRSSGSIEEAPRAGQSRHSEPSGAVSCELNELGAGAGASQAEHQAGPLMVAGRQPSEPGAAETQSEEQHQQQQDGRIFYLADTEYDLDELESGSTMLANLFQWNYPIFELAQCYGQSILSKLSYRIFFDSGFFDCK